MSKLNADLSKLMTMTILDDKEDIGIDIQWHRTIRGDEAASILEQSAATLLAAARKFKSEKLVFVTTKGN